MNKNIIIAILVVIIVAAAAALMFAQPGNKMDTQINFLNNQTFQNGEQVIFELKDTQGNALSGKMVNITYKGNETYSITTDQNGKGYLTISGEDAGSYDIEVKFAGDDKYNGCSAKDTITITNDLADNVGTTTGDAVTTTDQYNNNSNNGTDDGTYFLGQYELTVRRSDDVVIAAPGGKGVGLTVKEWMVTYGPDNPDYH